MVTTQIVLPDSRTRIFQYIFHFSPGKLEEEFKDFQGQKQNKGNFQSF